MQQIGRAVNRIIYDAERKGLYAYSRDFPSGERVMKARSRKGKLELYHLCDGKWYEHDEFPYTK